MANIFTHEPVSRIRKNWFDLNHNFKASTKFGRLTPIYVQECLPGDKFKMRSENLIRFAPLTAPVMHKMKATVRYFFVPNRILWSEWEQFITGGRDGTAAPPIPRFDPRGTTGFSFPPSSLGDYLGFPTDTSIESGDFNALVFAAYQRIFFDYFVDPNLDTEEFQGLSSGAVNQFAPYENVRQSAWRKDIFTSALPWAQRGPAVNLPLGEMDDVRVYRQKTGAGPNDSVAWDSDPTGATTRAVNVEGEGQEEFLYAETSNLIQEATTIRDLRNATALQSFFEKMARGGHRLFEVLERMFGVRNLDARLDRAEYIGGQVQDVVISEVLQTSESGETPLADMAGHALSASFGKNNAYFCPEHGWIIGIMCVMPDAAYSQGLPRMFSRSDRFDYYWKEFAHIGEQEILNKELYYDRDDNANNETFGYTPRYADLRYTPNRVGGVFRNTHSYWQMGRKFENRPLLNTDFIYTNPDAEYWTNIFNVAGGDELEDYLWFETFNHVKGQRPIPKYGVPKL